MKKIYLQLYYLTIGLSLISFLLLYWYQTLKESEKWAIKSFLSEDNEQISMLSRIFESAKHQNISNQNDCDIYSSIKETRINFEGEIYPKLIQLHNNKSFDYDCISRKIKSDKSILLWNNVFKRKHSTLNANFKCPLRNCKITTNKSDLINSDLVIFNLNEEQVDFPNRILGQLWSFISYEPLKSSYNYNLSKRFSLKIQFINNFLFNV